MQLFLKKESNEQLQMQREDILEQGMLLPSLVRLMGRVVSDFGGQPLRDVNIVRLIAVIASIAVVIGIGVCIAMLLLDILKVVTG